MVGVESDVCYSAEDCSRLVGAREIAELAYPHIGSLVEKLHTAKMFYVTLDIDLILVARFLRLEGINECFL